MSSLVVPTIHLNGTGKSTLMDEYTQALDAVTKARKALADVTVHGRDYYVQSPSAIQTALDQHARRMREILEIESDLELILVGITQQGGW